MGGIDGDAGFAGKLVGRRGAHTATILGVLVAFVQYIQKFFEPLRDLSSKYTMMQSAMAGAERIFGLDRDFRATEEEAQAHLPDDSGLVTSVGCRSKEMKSGRRWVTFETTTTDASGEICFRGFQTVLWAA